jgi:hypothetical protein
MIKWLFIFILLTGCVSLLALTSCSTATQVCPDQTKLEIGVTETDAKNDKLQEKKLLTQTWKWGKKTCQEK